MTDKQRTQINRILALIFVVALSVLLYLNREKVHELEALGYPGIFLISLLSNATLVLPVPGVLFTSAMGAVFSPFWVAIAAGSGASIGELSGYLAGFSGRGIVERNDWHIRVENWMRKFGGITIFVLAFVPNPIFDIAGLTAGILKLPIWKFFLWCLLGKIGKMMLFAYGGSFITNIFSGK